MWFNKMVTAVCILLTLNVSAHASATQAELNEALFAAIGRWNLESAEQYDRIQALVAQGADVNSRDSDGATPLILAVKYELPNVLKLLLSHGVDPNAADRSGNSALMYAFWWSWAMEPPPPQREPNRIECAVALLEHGARIDAANRDGMTPLMRAAGWNHNEGVKLLIEHGANIRRTDRNGASALTWAAGNGKDSQEVRLLQHPGVVVSVIEAILMRDTAGALEAIKHRRGLRARGPFGETALMAAARFGDAQLVDALLKAGADPNARDREGITPLIVAIAGMKPRMPAEARFALPKPDDPARFHVIRSLVAAGADTNSRVPPERFPATTNPLLITRRWRLSLRETTPLQVALVQSPLPVIRFLIQNGANVNQPGQDEMTPLMTDYGIKLSVLRAGPFTTRLERVRLLLDSGADVNIESAGGRTPLMTAVSEPDVLMLMLLHGAKVDVKDRLGVTALMYAAQTSVQSVLMLLDHGADAQTRDLAGCTALTDALEEHNDDEIVKLLRRASAPLQFIDVMLLYDRKEILSRLAHDADPNSMSPNGRSALVIAAQHGDAELVRLLLMRGAHSRRRGRYWNSALAATLDAMQYGYGQNASTDAGPRDYLETMRLLLDAGDEINGPNDIGVPPLITAIRGGYLDAARLLLQYHPDLTAREEGLTALEWAEWLQNSTRVLIPQLRPVPGKRPM